MVEVRYPSGIKQSKRTGSDIGIFFSLLYIYLIQAMGSINHMHTSKDKIAGEIMLLDGRKAKVPRGFNT